MTTPTASQPSARATWARVATAVFGVAAAAVSLWGAWALLQRTEILPGEIVADAARLEAIVVFAPALLCGAALAWVGTTGMTRLLGFVAGGWLVAVPFFAEFQTMRGVEGASMVGHLAVGLGVVVIVVGAAFTWLEQQVASWVCTSLGAVVLVAGANDAWLVERAWLADFPDLANEMGWLDPMLLALAAGSLLALAAAWVPRYRRVTSGTAALALTAAATMLAVAKAAHLGQSTLPEWGRPALAASMLVACGFGALVAVATMPTPTETVAASEPS